MITFLLIYFLVYITIINKLKKDSDIPPMLALKSNKKGVR